MPGSTCDFVPMDTNIFTTLRQTADAIIATFGPNCEVAVFDLANLKKSLCYLNGNITGRKIGAPATDILIGELQKQGKDIRDMYNYKSTTRNGRSLKTSTIFIRDSADRLIAALSINFDTTDIFNAIHSLAPLLHTGDANDHKSKRAFTGTAPQTVEVLFDQAVLEMGKQPASMSTKEKIMLTQLLDGNGAFRLKGAVEQIAMMCGVSRYTIYAYLRKIRTGKAFNQI
jgi:predicted transcriptional regulator YheO